MSGSDAPAAPRVLVADDHAATRRLVADVLVADGFEICATASGADEAIRAAVEHLPDVCVLDIEMPGGGIAAARIISERVPGVTVVMHTISEDHADLSNALRAGADGYLLKTMDPSMIGQALRAVMSGEAAIPRHLTKRLLQDFRTGRPRGLTSASGVPVQLSAREWEVLNLLHEGLSTGDIAARTYVSSGTVRSHIASIERKLGVRTREDAVRVAFE